MAGKGKKQVANKATQRSDSKTVRSEAQKGDGKPVWRFSTVDRNGSFSWPKGQQEELDIVQKLHQFDSMEWNGVAGTVLLASSTIFFLKAVCQKKQKTG